MGAVRPGQLRHDEIPDGRYSSGGHSHYDYQRGVLTIMYKVVGKGTEQLSRATKGTPVLTLGPLGRWFAVDERRVPVVVAGGIGFAGVYALIKKLHGKASIFFGCSTKDEVALLKDAMRFHPLVATLDGSCGFRGNVIRLLKKHLNGLKGKNVEIFSCGPDNMVKSLRGLIEPHRIPFQCYWRKDGVRHGPVFRMVKKTTDSAGTLLKGLQRRTGIRSIGEYLIKLLGRICAIPLFTPRGPSGRMR